MIRFLKLRPRFARRGIKRRAGRLQPPSLSAAIELLENRCLLSTTSIDAPDLQDISEDGDLHVVHLQSDSTLSKSGPFSKVNTSLAALFNDWNLSSSRGAEFSIAEQNSFLQVIDGSVVIDAVASEDTTSLWADLEQLGLEAGSSFGSIVSGRLPIDAIDDVSSLVTLQFASAAFRPWTNVGDVTSQGDVAMNSDDARELFGVDGSGITIGVLSDSFDTGPGSYSEDIASGDLPPGIQVLDDFSGGTDEGRGMMQLIHDVAPGADLAFHSAFNGGQAGFANGILDLANVAGAEVIVDDVLYFAEPMFQDGIIAQAVDAVVASGVSYFSSSGNANRASYESVYRNSNETLFVGGKNRGILHDFDPDPNIIDYTQSIYIPYLSSVIISFQWDEPFFSVSGGAGSASDLDFYIVDSLGTTVYGSSLSRNIGNDPVEVFQFTNVFDFYGQFGIMIANYGGGPEPGLLKYVRFDAGPVATAINEYDTASGTSYGHANAAGAEAVGAAYYGNTPAFGTDPAVLEAYSSAGGIPILFDTSGNRLTTPEIRATPGIVAPDGTDTTFFGQDTDGNGFPNFFGTSAAAPHAAAVAALMLELNPGLSPAEVYSSLESTALDMNAAGFDYDSGYGLIQADLALAAVPIVPRLTLSFDQTSIDENGGATIATLTRLNPGNTDQLTVNLVSSDTSEAVVDFSVIIPDGLSSTTFAVTAVDDDLADGDQTVTITASATGFFSANRSLVVIDDEPQFISNWANTVIEISSEWNDPFNPGAWQAIQALGEPDTLQYGDIATAWAASTADGTGEEHLTLGFPTVVLATGVTVRETWGNGFVKKVEVRDASTMFFSEVWSGSDPSLTGTPVDFLIQWPRTDFLVDAVKVTINSNHVIGDFEEIDAVQLQGWNKPPSIADITASAETAVDGTVSGSLSNTFSSDGVYETITEETYAGKKRSRLQHEWTFDVPQQGTATFYVEAYHNSSSVEDFNFAFSLDDGASWTAMLTVSKTFDDNQAQWFILPSSATGSVIVRVVDTDRSRNEKNKDSIIIDQMFIRVEGGGPALPQITIDATVPNSPEEGPAPGEFAVSRTGNTTEALLVNYTVTGTATAGVDYVSLSGSINILAGDSSATIDVTPINDSEIDPNETVIVTIDSVADLYTVDAQGSDTVTIVDDEVGDPPTEQFFFATTETMVSGTLISGSLADTVVSDDVYEVLEERKSGGKPSNRYSFLEHKWTFEVVAGSTVTFSVEALHPMNSDGDDFTFAWSSDDSTYIDMLTIFKTVDDDIVQSFVLSGVTSGTVYVRVTDTDQTPGSIGLDDIWIDQMFITSTGITSSAGVSRAFPTTSKSVSEPILSVAGDSSDGANDVQVASAVLLENLTVIVQLTSSGLNSLSDSYQDDSNSGQRAVVSVNEILRVGEPIVEQTEDEETEEPTLSQPNLLTFSASFAQIDSVIADLLAEGIVPTL